ISQDGNPFDLSWLHTKESLVVLIEINPFLLPLPHVGRATLQNHHPSAPVLRALYPRPHRQAGTPHILNGPRHPRAIKDNIHLRGRVIGPLGALIPPPRKLFHPPAPLQYGKLFRRKRAGEPNLLILIFGVGMQKSISLFFGHTINSLRRLVIAARFPVARK